MTTKIEHELLTGQVALVTGGTAGIGKAVCLKFIKQGASIIFFGTNPEKGQKVLEEIQEITGSDSRAMFYPVDVCDKQCVEKAIKECLVKYQKIDIIVNNAGIVKDNLLIRMSEAEWDQVLATNLKSCFNVCQSAIRPMIKARKGKIINITSVIGITGNAGQVNYAASKAGMIGFTKSLAKELASRNICVNCIAPGFIDTPMTQELPDAARSEIISKIPMNRMGLASDIADCALFLASEWSNYITGQVLVVDGGLVM